jgi:3-oxoadipate enol-lactonase
MAFAHCNGIDIYYERAGQGEPLLFISGSNADLRARPNQFDTILADQFELIGYDQRGLGQTAKPDGEYSMADYANDAAALLDHLGLARVPVVGVSFGGMVAQEFAVRYPQRVRRLVLACTSSGGAGGASYPLQDLADLPPRQRAEAHLKVADLRHDEAWIRENAERWETLVERGMAVPRADRNAQGAAKQLRARSHHDTYERLAQLAMPVLLAAGRRDGIAPIANMQAIHRQIPHSEIEYFDGGHMFLIQDKSAYPFIAKWLQGFVDTSIDS